MNLAETNIGGANRGFPSTSWARISRWRDLGNAERSGAVARLIDLYWKPVYSLIRHSWAKTNEDAKDLTQEFFLTEFVERSLLDKFDPNRGGFRPFLRTSVTNFMRHAARDARRQKRGGDRAAISLDAHPFDLSEIVPSVGTLTPEEVFDAAWKHTLMSRAVGRLEEQFRANGKKLYFEVFRRYVLDPEGPKVTYHEMGIQLGITTDTVRNYLTLARKEFKSVLMDLVREYAETPEDFSEELGRLFGA